MFAYHFPIVAEELSRVSDSPLSSSASKLDPNMKLEVLSDAGMNWYDPMKSPFVLSGFPWLEQDGVYRRLPVQPDVTVPAPVDALANCTAGGQIRFRTNSAQLKLRVKLDGVADMNHMPASGQCAFDCYVEHEGQLYYHSTGRYPLPLSEYETVLMTVGSGEIRTIVLYFPLYRGVKEVLIGIEESAELLPPPPMDTRRVIYYGTSITQGGCATRAGMAFTNIIGRHIPLEHINLGFSGNGKGEPELAKLVADITDPAMLVLDYDANSSVESMAATLPGFLRIYRERHPDIPILVVSRIPFAGDRFNPELRAQADEKRQIQRSNVERCRAEGDKRVYFLDGTTLLGDNYEECTVDGVHPTDLGFLRMADNLTPVIRGILKETGIDL